MRTLLAIGIAICVTACIDGDYVTVAGKDYNREQVQQLKIGMPAAALRSQVGEPVSIQSLGNGKEQWRFYWRGTRTHWAGIGEVKVRTARHSAHAEAIVILQNGKLERIAKNDSWVYE